MLIYVLTISLHYNILKKSGILLGDISEHTFITFYTVE
jgi:hypothetical protein